MASPERQELLRNAVVFLRDPKVCTQSLVPPKSAYINKAIQTQSSPLAQRVQFLEAKGLNSSEIEEAMRQASAGLPLALSTSQQYGAYPPAYGPVQYTAQPPHQWDWRDYFVSAFVARSVENLTAGQITAIVSGTVMYGAVALFKASTNTANMIHLCIHGGTEIRQATSASAVCYRLRSRQRCSI